MSSLVPFGIFSLLSMQQLSDSSKQKGDHVMLLFSVLWWLLVTLLTMAFWALGDPDRASVSCFSTPPHSAVATLAFVYVP